MDPGAVGQELLIHLLAADDESVILCGFQYILHRVDHLRPVRSEVRLTAQHQIAAVGKSLAAGQGVKGLAAHNDGVAGGHGLEAAQVRGQAEQEISSLSDPPALADGNNGLHRQLSLKWPRGSCPQRAGDRTPPEKSCPG